MSNDRDRQTKVKVKVHVDLYRRSRVLKGSHSFTCTLRIHPLTERKSLIQLVTIDCIIKPVADPDISFGGGGAEGDAPSPENFFNLLLKNGVFWSILMSKCASHV